jgi:hypothetical protein
LLANLSLILHALTAAVNWVGLVRRLRSNTRPKYQSTINYPSHSN